MRYLGGKSRIAADIARVVAPKGFWWEPFCGGLSVSVQLAKYGPGIVSDANSALIALYRAVRDGWAPPAKVSPSEYASARELPDTDPRKAFVGFGCSFRGKWFGGYARPGKFVNRDSQSGPREIQQDPAGAARAALLRDIPALGRCQFHALSFFDVDSRTSLTPETIYADPPYEGKTRYGGVPPLDHGRFWASCQEWAARGVRVFVSELRCPVPSDTVWEAEHVHRIGRTTSAPVVERLFRVQPPSVARCA